MGTTDFIMSRRSWRFSDAGVVVSAINPAQLKAFGRGLAVRIKTDGVGSFALARYGALLNPPPGRRRPANTGTPSLVGRSEAVAQDRHGERNRQEKRMPPIPRSASAKLLQDDGHI